ncbi:MAG TPA: TlyA family RNA methyltransferase [Pseudonocardiaceae bacterium]|nr:TlyA family RNA methyltransferase [Pseudonocardiaceae bacterium]
MPRRSRLDAELVRRGLARSRDHAGTLIAAGRVLVGGVVASKPATGVGTDAAVEVRQGAEPEWASRGAHKLLGALATFGVATFGAGTVGSGTLGSDTLGSGTAVPRGLVVAGRRCLDAGASTGGFTDVLLAYGAAHVVAVDVGYGQLAWRLRTDERVSVHDRTNVRSLTPEAIGGPVDLIVADLSFISLRLVLPALVACGTPEVDLLPMVKPQFEVGREGLGPGGVVRDPAARAAAVLGVVAAARELGLALRGAVASPLPGPSGNVEFFVWLRPGPSAGADADEQTVRRAVLAGPR